MIFLHRATMSKLLSMPMRMRSAVGFRFVQAVMCDINLSMWLWLWVRYGWTSEEAGGRNTEHLAHIYSSRHFKIDSSSIWREEIGNRNRLFNLAGRNAIEMTRQFGGMKSAVIIDARGYHIMDKQPKGLCCYRTRYMWHKLLIYEWMIQHVLFSLFLCVLSVFRWN